MSLVDGQHQHQPLPDANANANGDANAAASHAQTMQELARRRTEEDQLYALVQLCSAVGMHDLDDATTDIYRKGAECYEVLMDILRYLRTDVRNSERPVLRVLGKIEILQKDLIPLLIQYAGEEKEEALMVVLLRVMTAMTLPSVVVFQDEGVSTHKTLFAHEVDSYLACYKEAFTASRLMPELNHAGEVVKHNRRAALEALLHMLEGPITRRETLAASMVSKSTRRRQKKSNSGEDGEEGGSSDSDGNDSDGLGDGAEDIEFDQKRMEDDDRIIELVLTIIRNILHAPNIVNDPRMDSLHDRTVVAFDDVDFTHLVVGMCNNMTIYGPFKMLLLEILVLLYREQTADTVFASAADLTYQNMIVTQAAKKSSPSLPSSSSARHHHHDGSSGKRSQHTQSAEESQRAKQGEGIMQARLRELRQAASLTKGRGWGRHGRFGGSFEVKEMVGGATNTRIHSRSILKSSSRVREEGKLHRHKKIVFQSEVTSKSSPLNVRVCLYELAVAVIKRCFNSLVVAVEMELKGGYASDLVKHYDRINYLRFVRFFLEFHRFMIEADLKRKKALGKRIGPKGFGVGVVGFALGHQTVNNIRSYVLEYFTTLTTITTEAPVAARRLHSAIRAFAEFVNYVLLLSTSNSIDQRDYAASMTAHIFYQEEFLDVFPKMIVRFDEKKESMGLLKDLIETVHIVLKLLSSHQSNLYIKKKKRKARKGSKKGKKTKNKHARQTKKKNKSSSKRNPKDKPSEPGQSGNESDRNEDEQEATSSTSRDNVIEEDSVQTENDASASKESEDSPSGKQQHGEQPRPVADDNSNDAAVNEGGEKGEDNDDDDDDEDDFPDAQRPQNGDDSDASSPGKGATNADANAVAGDDTERDNDIATSAVPEEEEAGTNKKDKGKTASHSSLQDDKQQDGGNSSSDRKLDDEQRQNQQAEENEQEDENVEEEDDEEEEEEEYYDEFEAEEAAFQMNQYLEKFRDYRIVMVYCFALSQYKTNDKKHNHYIMKMFDRICRKDKLDARPFFYQLSVLRLFRDILDDSTIKTDGDFKEMRAFIKRSVVAKLVHDVQQQPILFVEMLFWKTPLDVEEIQFGHAEAHRRRRFKKSAWSEEDEGILRRAHQAHLGNLTTLMEELVNVFEDKTERMIKGKLRKMGLDTVDPRAWTDEDDAILRSLFAKHKDHDDVVSRIMDEDVFAEEKNIASRIKIRLRRLGLVETMQYKSDKEPWSDEELQALKDAWEDIAGEGRSKLLEIYSHEALRGRRPKAIRTKLMELELLKIGGGDASSSKGKRRKGTKRNSREKRAKHSSDFVSDDDGDGDGDADGTDGGDSMDERDREMRELVQKKMQRRQQRRKAKRAAKADAAKKKSSPAGGKQNWAYKKGLSDVYIESDGSDDDDDDNDGADVDDEEEEDMDLLARMPQDNVLLSGRKNRRRSRGALSTPRSNHQSDSVIKRRTPSQTRSEGDGAGDDDDDGALVHGSELEKKKKKASRQLSLQLDGTGSGDDYEVGADRLDSEEEDDDDANMVANGALLMHPKLAKGGHKSSEQQPQQRRRSKFMDEGSDDDDDDDDDDEEIGALGQTEMALKAIANGISGTPGKRKHILNVLFDSDDEE